MQIRRYMMRNFLKSSELELYDQILDVLKVLQVANLYTEVKEARISEVIQALLLDYPEHTFAWKKNCSIIDCTNKKGCLLRIEYYYEKNKIIKMRQDIDKYIKDNIVPYVESVSSGVQLDVVLAVYNYLSKVLVYSNSKGHSAYTLETLYQREGVCRGISLSLIYVLRMFNIECFYIRGRTDVDETKKDAPTHGWSMVKLDGKYYHLDLTWDLNARMFEYFLLNDSEIYLNHHRWDFERYPKAI